MHQSICIFLSCHNIFSLNNPIVDDIANQSACATKLYYALDYALDCSMTFPHVVSYTTKRWRGMLKHVLSMSVANFGYRFKEPHLSYVDSFAPFYSAIRLFTRLLTFYLDHYVPHIRSKISRRHLSHRQTQFKRSNTRPFQALFDNIKANNTLVGNSPSIYCPR